MLGVGDHLRGYCPRARADTSERWQQLPEQSEQLKREKLELGGLPELEGGDFFLFVFEGGREGGIVIS